MHLILKSCHTTGIIPVYFPLKSESSPFVYLRNSNTTGQPTDSIILVRCKYRGNQQESPSCYTASTLPPLPDASDHFSTLSWLSASFCFILGYCCTFSSQRREGNYRGRVTSTKIHGCNPIHEYFSTREKREKCFHPAD